MNDMKPQPTTKAEQNGCRPHGQLGLARVDLCFLWVCFTWLERRLKVGGVH
jgi:hypothetical protein